MFLNFNQRQLANIDTCDKIKVHYLESVGKQLETKYGLFNTVIAL